MAIAAYEIIENVLEGYGVHSDECTKEQYRNVVDTLKMVFSGIYEIREHEGRLCLHRICNGKLAMSVTLYGGR